MKLLVVGGVAGGATAAARARRLSETAEITVLERGPFVSYANCGLPYYVSRDIERRSKLLLQTPEGFESRYGVKVLVETEALEIDRAGAARARARSRGGGLAPLRQPHPRPGGVPGDAGRAGHRRAARLPDVDRSRHGSDPYLDRERETRHRPHRGRRVHRTGNGRGVRRARRADDRRGAAAAPHVDDGSRVRRADRRAPRGARGARRHGNGPEGGARGDPRGGAGRRSAGCRRTWCCSPSGSVPSWTSPGRPAWPSAPRAACRWTSTSGPRIRTSGPRAT